ncbi:MAG: response regulator [Proteobacteria bacterium]|nr:response regulator [Pseudomonadota bacterium]
MLEDTENLREALASAKRLEAALQQRVREQEMVLSGLQTLITVDDPAALAAKTFDLLRASVAFDAALILTVTGEELVCSDATDLSALGQSWPNSGFLRRVSEGRAAVAPANVRIPDWTASAYRPPPGAGLYVPIQLAGAAGVLVLCSREHGRYGSGDLAIATRLTLLVAQTLAARQQRRLADEARQASFERCAAIEANEAKSNFLANMSHEIRTPLNGVNTVADLLGRTDLSSRQSDMVGLIQESGRTLERLLNDVLDFSKIEAGRLTMEHRPFHLEDTLASVLDLFAAKADDKGLQFKAVMDASAQGWFEGDPLRLRQTVSNLLSNAVKFTKTGSVRVEVSAADEGAASRVSIVVRDTGCGFSQEAEGRLFSRFEQIQSSVTREFGGTGLGLAISRSLAQLMGGDITASSTPGMGAEFTLTFLARRSEAPVQAGVGPNLMDEVAVPRLRILVAEDNLNNQKIVGMVLEAIRAEVVFTENGRDALAALAVQQFDLVLMDLQMPVMDGLTATRTLRAQEALNGSPRLPVVALSANAMTHHVAEALEAGTDAHVAKPIRPDLLLSTITSLAAAAGGNAARAKAA